MRLSGAIWLAGGFLLGVLAVQWLPVLPATWLSASVLVLAGCVALRFPRTRMPAVLVLAMAWAAWCGQRAMDARLPHDLEGLDVEVSGRVDDLPRQQTDATRFVLKVGQAWLDGKPLAFKGKLRIAWYATSKSVVPALAPCERWHLRLRLKRPRGLVNPGGGDSERSLLERGIAATGYVREDPLNSREETAPVCIDGWRASIAQQIEHRVGDAHAAALLRAFAVGDTRGLSRHDWDVARANGASHLIAISGFHVGVAAIAGIWLARLMYVLWPRFGLYAPRLQVQAVAALGFAMAYGALAGFGLPTVRTLLMIAAVTLIRCRRRHGTPAQALAVALFAMLVCDPLAVLSAGFWLSFVGVAFLMFCLDVQGQGWRAFLRELTVAQLVMTVSLLPLGLWFFGQTSWVGVVSNLIAVPLVSFAVVPATLAGTLLLLVAPPLATPVLIGAGWLAEAQWWLFERMAGWPGAQGYLPDVRFWALLLAMLGAAWMFLPRGVPMRWLGVLLFLPLISPPLPALEPGAFRLWMLDVGQGLSVVVRTGHHALVFDAGARYPSEFDLGDAAVLPSLHALGINRLDMLVISHADNDHAGGAPAVAIAFPFAKRLAGEPARMTLPFDPCLAGQSWEWDGVLFRMLGPSPGRGTDKGNDRSCVLSVEGRGGRALLTGDIGIQAERGLAEAVGSGPPLVLQVPHHGSRTSSGESFIRGLSPALGLVSAGWRNRFGHPHPRVVERYSDLRVPLLNTAEQGAIEMTFPVDRPPHVTAVERARQARYWRE